MRKLLALFTTVASIMLIGCPAEDSPLPSYTDHSVFRVAIGNDLGSETIAIEPSFDLMLEPATGKKLWVAPAAISIDTGKSLDLDVSAINLSYGMMLPDISGVGYKEVRQYWTSDGSHDSQWEGEGSTFTSSLASLLLVGDITRSYNVVNLGCAAYPYPCSPSYPWWQYYGYEQWRYGNYWLNGGWYPRCGWWYAKDANQLSFSNGQWVGIEPAPNQFWIDYVIRYEVDGAGRSQSLFGRINLDNDGDGVSNWDEVQAGTDPNDPNSYPGSDTDVTVPNLSGLTEEEAEDAIGNTCLVLGTVTPSSSATVQAGYVISWSPHGTVPCGTAINLVISTGPATQTVAVPNLAGDNLAQASEKLANANLAIGSVKTANSATIPIGIVISWNPTGTVQVGSAVNIVLSLGPVVNPPEMSVVITSPASGQVYTIGQTVTVKVLAQGDPVGAPYKLIVRDAELVTRTVLDVVLGQEYSFNFTLTLAGTSSGSFTAYLESNSHVLVETFCPYSVVAP
jgi:hypothetical protein